MESATEVALSGVLTTYPKAHSKHIFYGITAARTVKGVGVDNRPALSRRIIFPFSAPLRKAHRDALFNVVVLALHEFCAHATGQKTVFALVRARYRERHTLLV